MRTSAPSLFFAICVLLLGPATAEAAVDLLFDPATGSVEVGALFDVHFVARTDADAPEAFQSVEAIIAWDPTCLELVGTTPAASPHSWYFNGLPPTNPLNLGGNDGAALFAALASSGDPAQAPVPPAGLIVTTFRFRARAESTGTVIQILAALEGERTRVFAPSPPNTEITGDISATANVIVSPAGPPVPGRLTLEIAPSACFNDDQIEVALWMRDLPQPVSGFQAYLQYDTGILQFRADLSHYTDLPFPLHFQPIATAEQPGGVLRLDGFVQFSPPQPPVETDAQLAVLVFEVGQQCLDTSVVFTEYNGLHSELSCAGDPVLTTTENSPAFHADFTPPQITCPPNATLECDESIDPLLPPPGGAVRLLPELPPGPDASPAGVRPPRASAGRLPPALAEVRSPETGLRNPPAFATATDNCDPDPTVTYSDSVAAGACPQEYVITRTWTATDACGNSASCVQTLTVVDTTAPSAVQGVIADCYADAAAAEAAALAATTDLADNCSAPADIAKAVQTGAGTCDTAIVVRVQDECGNHADYTYTTRVDGTIPTITCPLDITQNADLGACTAAVTVPAPAVGDNCAVATVVNDYNNSADASDTYPLGTTAVTWTVTDGCGNTAQCTHYITINDNDSDDDGVGDCSDNCPTVPNPNQADCDNDGVGDACAGEPDCNLNNIPDSCDITSGTSQDVNGDGIPDECQGDVTISGHLVSAFGTPLPDVDVCAEPGPVCDLSDAAGHYELPLPFGTANASVEPCRDGWAFTPPQRSYELLIADQSDQDYIGRFVYDLDPPATGDDFTGVGDFSRFTPSWLQPVPPGHPADFDCDGTVGVGDFSYFVTAWQRLALDPAITFPPCRTCPTLLLSAAAGQFDLSLALVPVLEPAEKSMLLELPTPALQVQVGEHYYVECWVRDDSPDSRGLSSVYTTISWRSELVTALDAAADSLFPVLSESLLGRAGASVGGSTFEPDVAAGSWVRVAVIEVLAAGHGAATYDAAAAPQGIGAYGRGIVPAGALTVIPAHIVHGSDEPLPSAGTPVLLEPELGATERTTGDSAADAARRE